MSKRFRVVLVAFLMTTACSILVPIGLPILRSVTATESSVVSTQDQLHQKFLERKQLLDQVVEENKLSMQFGRGSMNSLEYRQAKEAALRAGIDLCQSQEDRITIFDEILELYAKREKQLQLEVKAGQRGESDLREARLARLEVEIEQLREKLK